MGIKKFNPITPGLRQKVSVDYVELTASKPEKSLTVGIHKSGGRNHDGKMTMRQIGGGAKQKYRIIDFKRDKEGIPGKISTIERGGRCCGAARREAQEDDPRARALLP